eukprot:CAMPEP_0184354820 /NCGR_PEP_ID=MMETSP1089-20130417/91358_1 /TAXON_ID=38269 ORGANISM="Gloeochaete wittrockiana, Strain SAG46.84" /NCGR_SAMPLE_ID=MMETSP1089 /ASSEMBLY_ACC=CAM_ASM_000445 /LENGTH=156 /DNA_ID=CAMNT_0026691073 /DNA_START=234 /DNA_END=700 /DNA_ORIENTATION=-
MAWCRFYAVILLLAIAASVGAQCPSKPFTPADSNNRHFWPFGACFGLVYAQTGRVYTSNVTGSITQSTFAIWPGNFDESYVGDVTGLRVNVYEWDVVPAGPPGSYLGQSDLIPAIHVAVEILDAASFPCLGLQDSLEPTGFILTALLPAAMGWISA